MLRSLGILTAFCLLAASCVSVTSAVEAKQRSYAAGKYRANAAKHTMTAKRKAAKRKARTAKRSRSPVQAKPVSFTAAPRTPVDKNDCIAAAQASYAQAQGVLRRSKQGMPRELERVVSKLNELCGEEEFEKARISMEWMNRCLANIGKGSCSVDTSYVCAIEPSSETCSEANSRAKTLQ